MSVPAATMRSLVLSKTLSSSSPSLEFSSSQPTPSPPPGHLLVKVHASAIQPSDLMNAKGGFGSTTFPRIPGRDFSGVVAASNPPGSPLVGTAVFGTSGSTHAFTVDGFQAEYAVIPAEAATRKPTSMTHEQAATVGVPFSTALMTVKRARVQRGETVLVLGANGAVGRAASTVLEELIGCKVLRGIRGAGGDVDTAADPELRAISGVNAVIDTVGMPALTRAAVENTMAQGGRLAFISAPKTSQADLSFDMRAFYRAEKELVGVNSAAASIEHMAKLLAELEPLFAGDKWQHAVAGKWEEISLEDAPKAYASTEKGKKYVVKIV